MTEKPRRSAPWSHALDAVEKIAGGLRIRNFDLGDRRTSARLDALTWEALLEIADGQGVTLGQLAGMIDRRRPRGLSLTVALRCYALSYFRSAP